MMNTPDKPLKTVESLDEILNHLGERCIMQEHGLTDRPKSDEIQVAKNRIYQLMLSLVGEDEVNDENRVDNRSDCWGCYESDYCSHEIRDGLRAELRKKLSEHFNVEG